MSNQIGELVFFALFSLAMFVFFVAVIEVVGFSYLILAAIMGTVMLFRGKIE